MTDRDQVMRARGLLAEIGSKIERRQDCRFDIAALLETLPSVLESIENSSGDLQQRCDRLLAHQIVLDERLLDIETNALSRAWNAIKSIARRSPARGPQSGNAYEQWAAQELARLPSFDQHREISQAWLFRPLISVIIPACHPDQRRLDEAVRSVEGQSYQEWELCLAGNSLPQYASASRIQVAALPEDGDVATASNAAAALATGEYLAFLDPDAALSPFALHYIVEALQNSPAGALYSDEERIDDAGGVQPVFKPGWSPELLNSCMYIGRLAVVRTDLFRRHQGFSAAPGCAYDHDLLIRMAGEPLTVRHVPKVLYRGRGAFAPQVGAGVCRPLPAAPALSVVVCSDNKRSIERVIESVRATAGAVACEFIVVYCGQPGTDSSGCRVLRYSGPFHFAHMNNLAAAEATTPRLLFLSGDVVARDAGWCERLVAELERPEIGIAGAVLHYQDGSIHHAGTVLGTGGAACPVGRFQRHSALWPWLGMTRDVSAVSGACLGIRTGLFRELGGFDTRFPNNYSDTDFCLRARAAGYRVISLSENSLIYRGRPAGANSVSLREREEFYSRWAKELRNPDPFYSPSLSGSGTISLAV